MLRQLIEKLNVQIRLILTHAALFGVLLDEASLHYFALK